MEADLLAAIRAAPDDDAPRLVYADWLTARGDPRGERITLSVRAEAEDDEDLRAASAIVERNRSKTELPVVANARWSYRRGFPERLLIRVDDWIARSAELRAAAPLLRELELVFGWQRAPSEEDLFRSVEEMTLRRLVLVGEFVRYPLLFRAKACASLEELVVMRVNGPEVATAIADAELPRLWRLELDDPGDTARALIRPNALPALEELGLYGSNLDGLMGELVAWPRFQKLRAFHAGELGAVAAAALFSTRLDRLTEATLVGALPDRAPLWASQLVTLRGTTAIKRWPLENLRRLHVAGAAGAVEALARMPALATLERLELTGVHIEGARAALVDPVWRGLHALELSGQGTFAHGLPQVLAAANVPLRALAIERFGIPGVGAAIGRNAILATSLRRLALVDCSLADADARALAAAPGLDALGSLDVAGNGFGKDAIAALKSRFPTVGA